MYSQLSSAETEEKLNMVYSKKIFPNVDFRDAAASIEIWTKTLMSDINPKFSFQNIFIEGIDHVDEKFINDKVSFLILTAIEYLTNQEKLKNMVPTLLSSDDEGTIGIQYMLIAHKNSNINSLKDLKNKTISFVDDYQNELPHLWLNVLLKREGLSLASEFFKDVHIAQNANQAILRTFFGQIDVCIVPKKLLNTSFILNPQLESELVIIKESEPFIAGLFCANKNLSENITRDFIKSAKTALGTDKGKQVALFFRTKEIHDFNAKYLDNMKNLIGQADNYNIKNFD
jgi:ABC-type phosphate/phosphonate transport system substrate-binding protein